jgi:hypothetical protein
MARDKYPGTRAHNQSKSREERGGERHIARSSPPESNPEANSTSNNPSKEQHDRYDYLALALNFATFVAAGVAAAATVTIALISYRSAEDAHIAYTAMRRAFVTLLPIQLDATVEGNGDKIWTFTSTVENSGTTPTKNLTLYQFAPCVSSGSERVWIAIDPISHCNFRTKGGKELVSDPEDPAEAYSMKGADIRKYPLGPHAKVIVGRAAIYEAEINKLANESRPWYISGIVRYNDVFQGSRLHQTKYCYTVTMWSGINAVATPFLLPCDRWNCADEECDDGEQKTVSVNTEFSHRFSPERERNLLGIW